MFWFSVMLVKLFLPLGKLGEIWKITGAVDTIDEEVALIVVALRKTSG